MNRIGTAPCGATGDKSILLQPLAAGEIRVIPFADLSAGKAETKLLRTFIDSQCAVTEKNEKNNQFTKDYGVR